ncbi:hypothetical protein [Parvicella tangerina]|uniref:Uncharacterized protein n=1 Tax=Parvicella tangerina TaxID=2829795 RepID=A0A916NEW7_9FLAO|nr:hypothetical protein [Parvicella tangerina]CAG5076292.1 hypothetical protein CRYO30217_00048 [Parvicella tangerina]
MKYSVRIGSSLLSLLILVSCVVGKTNPSNVSAEDHVESNGSKEAPPQADLPAEERLGHIFCDCFTEYDATDSTSHKKATECFQKGLEEDVTLEQANEEATLTWVEASCPETASNVRSWYNRMRGN